MSTEQILVHAIVSIEYKEDGQLWQSPVPGHRATLLSLGGSLSAVVTSLTAETAENLFEDPQQAEQVALQHHHLLCELMNTHDVLPVKLGTIYSSKSAAMTALEPMLPGFMRALERCADAAEYLLKVKRKATQEGEAAPAIRTGRDYLAARRKTISRRREQRDHVEELTAKLEQELSLIARTVATNRKPSDESLVCEFTFLAERTLSLRCTEQLEDLKGRSESMGLELTITGPWPVYSFSQEAA